MVAKISIITKIIVVKNKFEIQQKIMKCWLHRRNIQQKIKEIFSSYIPNNSCENLMESRYNLA